MRLIGLKNNFNRLDFDSGHHIWFSYSTPIALQYPGEEMFLTDNYYSHSTSKHRNYLCDNKKLYTPHREFLQMLHPLEQALEGVACEQTKEKETTETIEIVSIKQRKILKL